MGTKLSIWKQGQFYPALGKKIIELPYDVNPGPSDALVKVKGYNVQLDADGNFIKWDYSEEELDAIHTYGIVRIVIDMYEKLFDNPISWSWQKSGNKSPLKVSIRNNDINARFLVDQQLIELDCYGKSDALIYNCRSVDLVAHETGHAILNSIFPEWQNGTSESRGIEEAFCDLTAMFMVISQYDLCEEVIRETNGDLNESSILSLFGVGYGPKDHTYLEIRNAINKRIYHAVDWSPYAYSQVLVGALYEILIHMYNDERSIYDKTDRLYQCGFIWMESIIRTFINCPKKEIKLEDFILHFLKNSPIPKDQIILIFKNRNLSFNKLND